MEHKETEIFQFPDPDRKELKKKLLYPDMAKQRKSLKRSVEKPGIDIFHLPNPDRTKIIKITKKTL